MAAENPKPADGDKPAADPLAAKIEEALIGNLTANNANPKAVDKNEFDRSRNFPPKKADSPAK